MRSAATALSWTSRIFGLMLLAVLVLPFGWQAVTGDQFLEVTGTSMTPTYHLGDLLVVQQPQGDELTRAGQIVVATFGADPSKGPFYVHRVWEVTDDGAQLKGDANDLPDPRPITESQVVGTPRAHLFGPVAALYFAAQTLIGRLALLALGAVFLIGVPRGLQRSKAPRTAMGSDLRAVSV